MDKLSSLKLFIASAECGTFAAAAQKCGADPSTISKAVKRLESSLDIRLFQRNTRAIQLTDAGRQYLETARAAIELLEQREEELRATNAETAGTLRVNTPIAFGRQYLLPLLEGFHAQYPQIRCDLNFSDKRIETIQHQFDVTIRTGMVEDSQMVVRQLTPMDFITCASPNLAKNLPSNFSFEDFDQHSWIRYRFQQSGKMMPILWRSGDETLDLNPTAAFIVDDGEAMAELCAAGLGLTQAPHFIVKRWLDEKRLVPLFPCYENNVAGTFLLYPKRTMLPKKTQVFIEYMVDALEAMGENSRTTWARNLVPYFDR